MWFRVVGVVCQLFLYKYSNPRNRVSYYYCFRSPAIETSVLVSVSYTPPDRPGQNVEEELTMCWIRKEQSWITIFVIIISSYDREIEEPTCLYKIRHDGCGGQTASGRSRELVILHRNAMNPWPNLFQFLALCQRDIGSRLPPLPLILYSSSSSSAHSSPSSCPHPDLLFCPGYLVLSWMRNSVFLLSKS